MDLLLFIFSKLKVLWDALDDNRNLIVIALWSISYIVKRTHRLDNRDIPVVLVVASGMFCALAFWGEWQAAARAPIYAMLAMMLEGLFKKRLGKFFGTNGDGEDETPPVPPSNPTEGKP